ncbi:MAG TPA: hypothetical protein DDY14_09750 [Chromatiaceae bacterium]|jgi:glycosyltransferase involved in cell wall biosynthesis|nr:MAG: hypothetical protein N838_12660 [Thiohalocapsa sp. PB-PSB1]QQO52289.1 MAG: glycosyltransferase [Thiohalocapsa sp. PB-PSB1]HBG95583.1 hypothetical protein [Chromatiaceae bacterium]HCS92913.1 hypothetical protein [Chromatiaceae bacterium]
MNEKHGFQQLPAPMAIATQRWPKDTLPVVSVCCITFNHERFIRDCLDGILAQRTTFPVEIVVHDDASNDGTKEIVQRYAAEYPQLFRLILQSENQWSQGIKPRTFVFPAARGQYIAICDGDDCWIVEEKLQEQVEALELHTECDISFHPAVKNIAGDQSETICNHSYEIRIIPPQDVIRGGGGFMPTSSIMIRSDAMTRVMHFFDATPNAPIGDIPIQVIGSSPGGALFLPMVACTYRFKALGSWTERIERDETLLNTWFVNVFMMYDCLNRFLDYGYGSAIKEKIQFYYGLEQLLDARFFLSNKRYIIKRFHSYFSRTHRLLWSIATMSPISFQLVCSGIRWSRKYGVIHRTLLSCRWRS